MKKQFSTDVAMKIIWLRMLEDLNEPLTADYRRDFEEARSYLLLDDIVEFRKSLDIRISFCADPYIFKILSQLKGFHKRYIFASDRSREEILEESYDKFVETQQRISQPIREEELRSLIPIWRSLSSEILGQYSLREQLQDCSFAKNACFGHPSRKRRLDQKTKGRITGSSQHLALLSEYFEEDPLLKASFTGSKLREVRHLKLTMVPKSSKAFRAIMPDTLAGSFYSYSLGRYIQRKLKLYGLDITRLQDYHRKMARRSSSDFKSSAGRRLATLDLSSASDSITLQLLELILPDDWYDAVVLGRIDHYEYNGNIYPLNSALTMGLGHTFPLETLVFYVLTLGIERLLHPKRRPFVSVYGDDIICRSDIVRPLTAIFRKLHLQVNLDKSFWGLCDFRESCGGDYYRGCDVRPSNPEGVSSLLSRRQFSMFLYKVANSLLHRWSLEELPRTIQWIHHVIKVLDGFVLCVPPSYPDESGLKVDQCCVLETYPISRDRNGSFRIQYWRLKQRYSPCINESIYLWSWFSTHSCEEDHFVGQPIFTLRKRRSGPGRSRLVPFLVDPGRGLADCESPHTSVNPKWE